MAFLPVILAVAGTVMGYAGKQQSASAASAKGQQEQMLADMQAGQIEASGQKAGFEQERRARLLSSRALAVAAASGNAGDPTATRIMANIMGEGAYAKGVELYDSEEKAMFMRMEGKASSDIGGQQASALRQSATADLVSSAGSLYGKYGAGGPNTDIGSGGTYN